MVAQLECDVVLARGGVCLRARTSRTCGAAQPLLPKEDARIVAARACRTMHDPTLLPRLSLAATRSSKRVPLLEGEAGLCGVTPARNTYLIGHASQPTLPRQRGGTKACIYRMSEANGGGGVQVEGSGVVAVLLLLFDRRSPDRDQPDPSTD